MRLCRVDQWAIMCSEITLGVPKPASRVLIREVAASAEKLHDDVDQVLHMFSSGVQQWSSAVEL